jgi:hypothetical protein
MSHRINHLTFGSSDGYRLIKLLFNEGELTPLDGHTENNGIKKHYEYYMKIVPTTYVDIYNRYHLANQFTSHSHSGDTMFPSIYFKYEMSPITVKFSQYREEWIHFIVQICAILGGIFTVTGIIDAVIHKSILMILRKANMGKLT